MPTMCRYCCTPTTFQCRLLVRDEMTLLLAISVEGWRTVGSATTTTAIKPYLPIPHHSILEREGVQLLRVVPLLGLKKKYIYRAVVF
jgi:hypothetical protein